MASIAIEESKPSPSTTVVQLPEVEHGGENKGVLTFTIKNVNVSIINAIRRVILSDLPITVFDTDNKTIEILANTSRFHNEILKQRLGCIPIHIKEKDIIDNLLIELDVDNDTDKLAYVTTSDFKIKDITSDKYLTKEQTKQIFPPNHITKEFILFTRLRPKISNDIPGEQIHLSAKLKIGTAKEDGMYNIASTCAYKNTEDKVEQHNQWQSIAEELEENGVSANKIEYQRKNWYTLQAKRYFIKDSFDFRLQSIGVYKNIEILHMACDNIIQRLDQISQKCDSQSLQLNKDSSAMNDSVDIVLKGEDYTIGKVIEYILHEQYYKKDNELSYIGFIKKHPHDDYSIIRMAFSGNSETGLSDSNVHTMIKFACDIGKNIYNNIKEYF